MFYYFSIEIWYLNHILPDTKRFPIGKAQSSILIGDSKLHLSSLPFSSKSFFITRSAQFKYHFPLDTTSGTSNKYLNALKQLTSKVRFMNWHWPLQQNGPFCWPYLPCRHNLVQSCPRVRMSMPSQHRDLIPSDLLCTYLALEWAKSSKIITWEKLSGSLKSQKPYIQLQ